MTPAAFLSKLVARGGIVEERICADTVRNPSVQLQVTPTRQVELLSTHDQILGGPNGREYLGCRFPADRSYAPAIAVHARHVADQLADMGVIGRFAIDFVVARKGSSWQPFAVELNLRLSGTTHPYQALAHLVGGAYDADSATFTTACGQPRHYVATDHLEAPQLRALGRTGLLRLARRRDLHFDRRRCAGTVFHMLSSLDELGRTGFTAIGDSAETAAALYGHVRATLLGQADRRHLRAALSAS